MGFNNVQKALEMTEEMLRARAAAQIILQSKYPTIVGGWMDHFREKMREEHKTAVEVMCDRAEKVTDHLILIFMLAATIEIVEEEAQNAVH